MQTKGKLCKGKVNCGLKVFPIAVLAADRSKRRGEEVKIRAKKEDVLEIEFSEGDVKPLTLYVCSNNPFLGIVLRAGKTEPR